MAKTAANMPGGTFLDKFGNVIDLEQYEAPDRFIVQRFIKPHHRVLELGARYGTVSCCINALLSDPRGHVVVEPDHSVIAALQANREAHGARFRIFFGAISNVPLSLLEQVGQQPFVGVGNSTIRYREGRHSVPITSVSRLQRDHEMQFNALVADCEGALETFFRENPLFPAQLELIILERDAPEHCDYERVDEILRQAGLRCVVDAFHAVYVR